MNPPFAPAADSEGGTYHPDAIALDDIRRGVGAPRDVEHVNSCELCAVSLASIAAIAAAAAKQIPESSQVPLDVDAKILDLARLEMAQSRKAYRDRRRRRACLAAAACLLMGLSFVALQRSGVERSAVRTLPVGTPGPTLDVVDVYRLSRSLSAGAPVDPAWDSNRDGIVDSRDVDELLVEVVALSSGRRR